MGQLTSVDLSVQPAKTSGLVVRVATFSNQGRLDDYREFIGEQLFRTLRTVPALGTVAARTLGALAVLGAHLAREAAAVLAAAGRGLHGGVGGRRRRHGHSGRQCQRRAGVDSANGVFGSCRPGVSG